MGFYNTVLYKKKYTELRKKLEELGYRLFGGGT